MAYGTGSVNQFPPGTKVLYFNLKDKDLPAPLFQIQEKSADGSYNDVGTATRVEGDIVSISSRENEYNGKKIRSTSVVITDDAASEAYIVSIPYTHLGRNIMNSLLGLKTFDSIELSVYRGKPKTPGTLGFNSSALRQNGELIYGKHEYKSLPEIPKVQVGPDKIANPTVINDFFLNEIKGLQKLVKEFNTSKPEPVGAATVPDTETATTEVDPNNPPF